MNTHNSVSDQELHDHNTNKNFVWPKIKQMVKGLAVGCQDNLQDLIPELFSIALKHTYVGQIGAYIRRHCVTIDGQTSLHYR